MKKKLVGYEGTDGVCVKKRMLLEDNNYLKFFFGDEIR